MKNYKSLCVLGRQPVLGLAELESLYGADAIRPLDGVALLDVPAEDINFKRLGGVIKTARILDVLDYTDWPKLAKYLELAIPSHLQHVAKGKFTLGLSVYGMSVPLKNLERSLLQIKNLVKKTGRPMRVVPNKELALSSAQVLYNKLTRQGAWEILLVHEGSKTIIAQTLFVQDINDYASRDQARPRRDARVGMLPPKLAQIMVNLAKAPEGARILDPFCGTGVVLQEALLDGYHVLGSDIDPRMVDYTKQNLAWLVKKYPKIEGSVAIEVGDATTYQWPRFTAVVSEAFLGRPLSSLPDQEKMHQIVYDANTIAKKFLANIAGQLKPGQKLVLALPAWHSGQNFIHLPVLAKITDMGYTYSDLKHVRRSDLIYYREDQIVARELVILEKA